MGLRDRFKRGGGFLNNVDGVVTELVFTDSPDFGGKASKSSTQLFAAVTVRVDGAEKAESTHLFVGNAEDFDISEDGHVLTPTGDGGLWGNTAFDNFYGSLCDKGLEDVEPNDDGSMDFSHVVGVRARFIQVKDEQAMERSAKNWKANKQNAKKLFNEQGQKKGNDGKYYDIRTLQVSEVYSVGNDVDAPPVKGGKVKPSAGRPIGPTGKSASKTTTSRSKVEAEPEPEENESVVPTLAEDTLVALLKKQPKNALDKTKLNMAITRELAKSPEHRDDVRVYLADDDNLNGFVEAGLITYKKNVITLV